MLAEGCPQREELVGEVTLVEVAEADRPQATVGSELVGDLRDVGIGHVEHVDGSTLQIACGQCFHGDRVEGADHVGAGGCVGGRGAARRRGAPGAFEQVARRLPCTGIPSIAATTATNLGAKKLSAGRLSGHEVGRLAVPLSHRSGRAGSDDPVLHCVHCGAGPVRHAQLAVDVLNVVADGLWTDS